MGLIFWGGGLKNFLVFIVTYSLLLLYISVYPTYNYYIIKGFK